MDALLDRDVELAELGRRLARVRAGVGGVVVVEGPAGIGKSSLLAVASRAAARDGAAVLRASCSPLEQDAAWGVARQLVEPLRSRPEWPVLSAGAAVLAERVLDAHSDEPIRVGDSMHAAVRGLTCLAGNLAERGPVVVVVDDVHWADAPSLRWLAVLARSLPDLPVGVLCALRTGEPVAAPDVLPELVAGAPEPPLRPRRLGAEASATLVRSRLPAATAAFLAACHTVTGGNPFLLIALVGHVVAEGLPPDDGTAARLDGFGPEQVSRVLERQLARLPENAGSLARAIAVLGPGAELRHAAGLAGLDIGTSVRAADALHAAGLLRVGTGLTLAHPLIAGTLYAGMPPGERAMCHARAAALMTAERADPERVGLHLLRTEPIGERATVDRLREAARLASSRGAPQSAASFLRRALAEPPLDPADEAEVRLELGLALAAYMHPDAYDGLHDMMRVAVAVAPTPEQRGRIALDGARALGMLGHFDRAFVLCRQALEQAERYPPELRERLEAELVTVGSLDARTAAEAWRHTADRSAPGPVLQLWRVIRSVEAGLANRPAAEVDELLRPVLEQDLLAAEVGSLVQSWLTFGLIASDHLPFGLARSSALVDMARPRGWLIALAHGCMFRACALVRAGEIRDAEPDARLAFDYKLPVAPAPAMLWCLSFLVDALVEAGDLAGADEALSAAGQQGEPPAGAFAAVLVLQSRARLRLAQHRPAAALADAFAARDRAAELGIRHVVIAAWRAEAVEALIALGNGPEARRLALEQRDLADELGAACARGTALRLLGRTDPEPVPLLERAVAVLADSPYRLEHTRALVDLGAALRRANRRADARLPLRAALEQAERGGMQLLARRAREELSAAGARPRRSALSGPAALTPAEHRIAALAALGESNRGIAERLYITQRTVETHLTHAFAKLQITTRAELAGAMGIDGGGGGAPRPRHPDGRRPAGTPL